MLASVRPQENAHVRLIAFPHAGGSATAYRLWELPPEIELFAVQQPGRGLRHAEPSCSSLDELCNGIIEALRPTLDVGIPFAFFGHSFGSLVAVEVARTLEARGLGLPFMVLVSAHPAPGTALASEQTELSHIADDEVRDFVVVVF